MWKTITVAGLVHLMLLILGSWLRVRAILITTTHFHIFLSGIWHFINVKKLDTTFLSASNDGID